MVSFILNHHSFFLTELNKTRKLWFIIKLRSGDLILINFISSKQVSLKICNWVLNKLQIHVRDKNLEREKLVNDYIYE